MNELFATGRAIVVTAAFVAGCGGDSPGIGEGPDAGGGGDSDADFDTSGPCGPDAEDVLELATDMVVCESIAGPWAQWAAAVVCNDLAGWHLCTPDEYLTRGGADAGPAERAWIAGCVRDGADVHAPTAGVCGEGNPGNGELQDYVWDCDSMSGAGSSQLYLGIYAIDECHRLGVPDDAWAGYWSADWGIGLRPAVCCE